MSERDSERLVHYAVAGGVATITLDSPGNRNALSRQLLEELHEALDQAEQPGVRVTVLTHTLPAFCAGADLKERGSGGSSAVASSSSLMVRAIERLGSGRTPTIAAVSGPARAGGVGVMAACDLVVVHPSVTFAFSEVRIGVAPAIISVPILARCGWSKLAAPFLTGEAFSAERAYDMGLITHVADDVAATVAALVAGVLASGPEAVAATRRILRSAERNMVDMQALSETLFNSAEAAEGMRAFAAKSRPAWSV
ncbi:MAG: enoyl-CoA hydratase/isomerase family protein [Actinomycetia bacterium]|nr:enoyl-CoA hydratase/isomerase family protein [Actinomycetes bacterium]